MDIPSHVYETPKDEYWYDEVMVKPVDTEQNLYYQVYDTTSLWGNNYLTVMPNPVSTQKMEWTICGVFIILMQIIIMMQTISF